MIVVNKTDLLEVAEAEALVDTLRESSRGGVQVVTTAMGKLPIDVLLGQSIGAEGDLEARHELHHNHHDHHEDHGDDHDHAHDHDAFESFVVTLDEIADTKAFSDQVSTIIGEHDILRLKGFAAVSGKPMRLTLQAVGPRVETYFDQPFGDIERATRLVVIGQAGLDHAAIEAALKSCAAAQ
jgi:cobalamin biosynthesis protein CobW